MNIQKLKANAFFQAVQLFFVLVIFFFTQNELIVALWILFLTAAAFYLEYHKNEWKLFLAGIIIGTIIEIGGDAIAKMQFWDDASFFGIPLWLPLIWGYGFIFIRRIGNRIVCR